MLRYRGCREALRRNLRSYPCTVLDQKKGRERCRPRPSKPSITQPKLESNSPVFVLPVEGYSNKGLGRRYVEISFPVTKRWEAHKPGSNGIFVSPKVF